MKQNTIPQPTIETVKEALLSLGEVLEEAEAIGIFGSLARGTLSPRSDIDVFVVVREKDPHGEDDMRWWLRIQRVLEPFQRDVTVLVYTVRGLKQISNWYVLRLASEGVIVYDRGGITQLFQQILSLIHI